MNCKRSRCNKPVQARGLCSKHYRIYLNSVNPPCKVLGCSKPVFSLGWCRTHYYRDYRNGDTSLLSVIRIRQQVQQ